MQLENNKICVILCIHLLSSTYVVPLPSHTFQAQSRHPDLMPESLQLSPFKVKEQRFYSVLLRMSNLLTLSPDTWQTKLITTTCILDLSSAGDHRCDV